MQDQLADGDFERVGSLIQNALGIKMPPVKKVMLESRLAKRVRALQLPSLEAYCDFLFSDSGMDEELPHLMDIVTTNKTDFFREDTSFEFLTDVAIPERLAARDERMPRLRFWSAACSTGEEPYTMAMVIEEYQRARPEHRFDYTILASDISTRVLAVAQKGIYPEARVIPVPDALRRRYLLRGTGQQEGAYRVAPELRQHVRFARLNLMEPLDVHPQLDVIFCRNVIIYFDRERQVRLLSRLCELLCPGGFLIMGHSEVLNAVNLPLTSVRPMIYRKHA